MQGAFSATIMLLVAATPGAPASVASGKTNSQNCVVRTADMAGGGTTRMTYVVECPGTASTTLSVSYESFASEQPLKPQPRPARASGR